MKPISTLLVLATFAGVWAERNNPPKADGDMVIVSTDGGADDATALIQVMEAPGVKLLAVLCTYGNVPLEQSCDNVRRTLQLMGKADQVPVYAGCDQPLIRTASFDGYFGHDGMGNNSYKFPLPDAAVRPGHAANVLNAYVNLYPGQITLLSLGPLTDLAVALRLDSSLPSKLKHVYMMGGTSRAIGNTSPVAEFNIHDDPEAARAVINEFSCPVTVSTLELCGDNCPTWEWFDEWVSSNTSIAFFIQQTYEIARQKSAAKGKDFDDHDLMAATVFLYPEVVTERAAKKADVETCSNLSLGQLVVDNRAGNDTDTVPNVDMPLAVDRELLLQKWADIVRYDVDPRRG